MRGARVLRARSAQASHARLQSPVSLSVFSLVPELLFDCLRVLEYAKIRTVLQSKVHFTWLFFMKPLNHNSIEKDH